MLPKLRFRLKEVLFSEVLAVAIAGGAAAMLADLLGRLTAQPHLPHLILGGCLGATLGIHEKDPARTLQGLCWGLAGGSLFGWLGSQYAVAGLFLFGACIGLAFAHRQSTYTKLNCALASAVGCFLGSMIYGSLYEPFHLALPHAAAQVFLGGAFGFFMAFGLLPRRLAVEVDRVDWEYNRLKEGLRRPYLQLARQALDAHRGISSFISEAEGVRTEPEVSMRSIDDLVLNVFRLCARCQEVESLANLDTTVLESKIRKLETDLKTTADEEARWQLEQAKRVLESQLDSCRKVQQTREQITSVLSSHVALIESIRLSMLHLKSMDVQRLSGRSIRLYEEVKDLNEEMLAASEALSEVDAL